ASDVGYWSISGLRPAREKRTRRLERRTFSIFPRPYSGWEMISPALYRSLGLNDRTSLALASSDARARWVSARLAASGSTAVRRSVATPAAVASALSRLRAGSVR